MNFCLRPRETNESYCGESRSSVQNFDNCWFWIRKTNALFNLINEQNDIDKIYLYAKDLTEPKYES